MTTYRVHHIALQAVAIWKTMYEIGRPCYMFFSGTGDNPKLRQLEETLAIVDECERDFAADLEHVAECERLLGEITEFATARNVSTPATNVSPLGTPYTPGAGSQIPMDEAAAAEIELAKARFEDAKVDIQRSQVEPPTNRTQLMHIPIAQHGRET